MNDFLKLLGFTALPAAGILAGWLLAEAFPLSKRTLSLALHGAAGIVLSMVAVELMPQALKSAPSWLIILCFVLGGLFFFLLDQSTHLVHELVASGTKDTGPWGLFMGVAVDLFTDGIMISSGATVSARLGLLLALSHVPSTIPMGFSSFVSFRKHKFLLHTRALVAVILATVLFAGGMLGYWAMRDRSTTIKMALLGFTAGSLTTLVIEEIVPEAHAEKEARFSALIFVGGFALFSLLSILLND